MGWLAKAGRGCRIDGMADNEWMSVEQKWAILLRMPRDLVYPLTMSLAVSRLKRGIKRLDPKYKIDESGARLAFKYLDIYKDGVYHGRYSIFRKYDGPGRVECRLNWHTDSESDRIAIMGILNSSGPLPAPEPPK